MTSNVRNAKMCTTTVVGDGSGDAIRTVLGRKDDVGKKVRKDSDRSDGKDHGDHSAATTNQTSTSVSSLRNHPTQEYLDQLVNDKNELKKEDGAHFRHLQRLVDVEISRVLSLLSHSATNSDTSHNEESANKQKITLTEKIIVPVDKYPRYNFVGRILGPRGMTAKQLEEETGCKIMVRGRGAASRQEPLHVLIQCEDYEETAHQRMKEAVEKVNLLLHPPPEGKDELKRKQLIELSIINGTYRPTSATKVALQTPRGGFGSINDVMSPFSDSRCVLNSILDNANKAKQPQQPQHSVNQQRQPKIEDDDDTVHAYSKLLQLVNPVPLNYAQLMQTPPPLAPAQPPAFNELYNRLLAHSISDPTANSALISLLLSQQHHQSAPSPSDPFNFGLPNMPNPFAAQLAQSAAIPQANFQQYLQAAAMLNAMPYGHDGSGDSAPNKMKR